MSVKRINESTDLRMFKGISTTEHFNLTVEEMESVMFTPNKENANVPHGPEATNMTFGEMIKSDYACKKVFSPDVVAAHKDGSIHIHDMGMIDRVYCGGQSLEYVKKYGLSLPNSISIAKPAKHAEVLIAQMIKFSAALQGHFAGAIGWDAVNVFLAPYLVGKTDKELKQLAQILIYEFAQQAVARGGQSIFSDLNIYWEIPDHFVNTQAIGPGGEYTGHTYPHYQKEAQRFALAMVEVYMEGDGAGRPFFFPKPEFHITEKFYKTEGHEEFLLKLSELASVRGTPYFVFDRGDTAKVSQCCRLSFKLNAQDIEDASRPETMRFSALQNVSINLPRIALIADGSFDKFKELLRYRMEQAVKAHIQKKEFITKLMKMGTKGPLSMLTMECDGTPYFRIEKASYLIGMVGMNEAVKILTGKEMHEDKNSVKMGIGITALMHVYARELGAQYGINLPLEQSPAESTAYRFAKLDMETFEMDKVPYNGDWITGDVYYTNSTYLNVGANVDPITRVKTEGMFHPLIEAGALTHVWLGESMPDASSIASFVTKTFKNTQNAQIAFSPEFTSCNECNKTTRGLEDKCTICGSTNVDHITRVTGFFSKVKGWNPGKKAELKDRHRVQV